MMPATGGYGYRSGFNTGNAMKSYNATRNMAYNSQPKQPTTSYKTSTYQVPTADQRFNQLNFSK
jgi:hypothetical protein